MSTASAATQSTEDNHQNVVLNVIQPGTLHVITRKNQLAVFTPDKIAVAITKAFIAVEGQSASPSRIHSIATQLTEEVVQKLERRYAMGGTVHIEEIQDKVELTLMQHEHHRVARAYVLYREERRKEREQLSKVEEHTLRVTFHDGLRPLNLTWLRDTLTEACQTLTDVDSSALFEETLRSLYDGVPIADVRKALVLAARTMIEEEPNYSFVAARLLLQELYQEAHQFLALPFAKSLKDMAGLYAQSLRAHVHKGIALELLDPRLTQFDLDRLGAAIDASRDLQFNFLGLQTLYDRYFIHHDGAHFELPQVFFMRVAMGLAVDEKDKNARAIEFYELLSSFDYMSSTPTLFNSGTLKPQLSSCYLTTVPDDLSGIYEAIRDNALLSKFAGGLGNDWTPVRAMNAYIKGTNGRSQGVVPFMNVANATAVAVNQGGKRKGAVCAYLETWHMDIEEFLELRKNTGDDRRRTHDMNTANWIPDLFMKRVIENKPWTLFSPDEVKDLHDLYGEVFEEAYEKYEAQAQAGKIRNFKTVQALDLWRKMLSMLFETGHPWVTFKDPCNIRSPQQHVGVIHSSNLCTEITLNTSQDEIAVCNLGSINLAQHVTAKGLDMEKLQRTVRIAIRMLDNVIDINYYSVPQARRSNLKHRPIGLGIMGFQDALYALGFPYASQEAVEFADSSMEAVSYYAISASTELAEERGRYQSFEGSLWSRGILPIDSIENLQKSRGFYLDQDRTQRLDWNTVRNRVKTIGMRNSNVLAIAPTATISNICGVSQSIEPCYQNLYVKSNLSGEFTVVNPALVVALKQEDVWDSAMVNDLKYYNGSLQAIERIPSRIKALFATAFEIDPRWLVECASRRQKWIDQAQSLNLYLAKPSGKTLDTLYRTAWMRGLKTTYYLRTMGATNAEKSTIHDGALNAVRPVTENKEIDCEACQ